MQTVGAIMRTTKSDEMTFFLNTEKLLMGAGIVLAIIFTLIAWTLLPNEAMSGANIVGRNIIPYTYMENQSLPQQCYQEEKRFGRILTADTNCK